MIDIKLDQVFNVVEDKNRKGRPIYRLFFRYSGEVFKTYNRKEDAIRSGTGWIGKNKEKAADMVFELEVLS